MALDYNQSAQLRGNVVFMGRIGTAALKWASYVLGNDKTDVTSAQVRRQLAYAQEIYNNTIVKAQQLQPAVVQDNAVQNAGIDPDSGNSTISDDALQQAVEGVIGKVI